MDNQSNVRLAAASILLDRGVRFTITGAPWYWRMLRLNKIRIRPLRAGTIMEISRLIDENELDDIRVQKDANTKLDTITLIIAVAMLNSKRRIRLFSGILARLLLWQVPVDIIRQVYSQIAKINKVSDFMSITIYFDIQAQMMMSPKEMGQMKKGS
ncbi:MAG: hypothetical protein ACLVKO_01765 [Dysgonomonas sp.]